jgi:hypothetical protein
VEGNLVNIYERNVDEIFKEEEKMRVGSLENAKQKMLEWRQA